MGIWSALLRKVTVILASSRTWLIPLRDLECYLFAEDRLVLVVPRRHALSRRREIAFRDSLEYRTRWSRYRERPAGNIEPSCRPSGSAVEVACSPRRLRFYGSDGGKRNWGRRPTGSDGTAMRAIDGHPRCSPNGQLGASPLFCLCSRSQVAANTRSMARSALVRSLPGARNRTPPRACAALGHPCAASASGVV